MTFYFILTILPICSAISDVNIKIISACQAELIHKTWICGRTIWFFMLYDFWCIRSSSFIWLNGHFKFGRVLFRKIETAKSIRIGFIPTLGFYIMANNISIIQYIDLLSQIFCVFWTGTIFSSRWLV